ncbi:sensor histidine kinase [Caminibacter pacificus]
MNNLRNELFYKFALTVFLIIAFFEGALMFAFVKSFDTHLKDKLALVAAEINPTHFNKEALVDIQHKYKVFPLFVRLIKPMNKQQLKNIKLGYKIQKIRINGVREKVLSYSVEKNGYIVQIATLYSTNDDRINIIKTISILISFVIYLIILMIGYKFIDAIAKQIEMSFAKLKRFNSNVSHELKTPLAIMKSEIEVALMNNTKDCEKTLKSMLQEINYINDITEKLLFLTKETKKIKLEDVDLEELILELFEKYAEKIEFELDFGDEEYDIKGDKTLLKMALSNIIENSIKYGANKIVIKLEKNKHKIILTIKDNGIGIPKEKLPFIFDEFYRVDESHNKKIKGFGLGLSIVKNILTLHKAKIKVNSDEGKGVEFIIEFPLITHQEKKSA